MAKLAFLTDFVEDVVSPESLRSIECLHNAHVFM